MIKKVPLPDYMPDQSQNSGVLLKAENVFPAMDGYRSIGEVLTVSDALAAKFQGGSSAISTGGTAYLLAGTATNLYKVTSAGAWTSLVGSLTIAGRWRFAQFGNYAIAVNGAATRAVDLTASTDAAIAGAPTGTSICVVGDHVVVGQSNGNIVMVRWSAFRDHTGWTNGTNQAGEQPMQTGGTVMGVCGGEYGIVLQRERIVRMTRTGDTATPFFFDEISSNFGCAAAATIAQAGRTIFFRSDRGFMALEDGQVLKPIGSEKVDRTFDALVSRDDLESIFTAVDPQNKLVMWGVPGSPGTLWIYNFELDKWSTAKFAFEGIMPGFTSSIGLDDLAVTHTNLDAMTISLDDPRWQGGNPRLYLFDTLHTLGTLHGDKLAAQFDLGFAEIATGRRARVRNVRPVWDGTSGMTVTLNAKARLGDNDNTESASTLRTSGIVPIRASGRYISTSVQVAAETDWDYIQSLEFEFEPGGKR
jgi:hypothetical protein